MVHIVFFCSQYIYIAATILCCDTNTNVPFVQWEGHCYDGCMLNASHNQPCFPSCNVESDMLDTLARVKALNPSVTGVVYLNTLMAFPFYALSGKFADADALLIDMYTGKPVELTNDEDMKNVWVYDWG